MALHVGLGQHVHAVFVAEVVEHRVVGVVRGADGVDVQSLHGHDVALNLLGSDGPAVDGRKVVAVDAVKHHTLAVDDQGTVAADAHLTEADLAAANIDGLAVHVLQRQHQVVEVGRLGAPQLRGRHVHVEAQLGCRCRRLLGNGGAVAHDLDLHRTVLDGLGASQPHLHVRLRVLIITVEVGGEEVVAYLALRCCPEEATAVDARQSPVVLAL